MAHADTILAREMVVGCDSHADQTPCKGAQFPLSNPISRHTLSAIDSFEDQAEQHVRKLPGQWPASGSPPSHPSEGLFDGIKGIPTCLIFRNEIFATDIRMLDVIGLV